MVVVQAVNEDEPILQSQVASADGSRGAGLGIPAGMRAVSVHAADSSGVIALLRAGHKIDVQVVGSRGQDTELRTMLQNMEVLSVDAQPDPTQRTPSPVITLLATPAQADLLGLADSAARIRIALRNPLDDTKSPAPALGVPALFRESPYRGGSVLASAPVQKAPAPAAAQHDLNFSVRILGAAPGAIERLGSQSEHAYTKGHLEVVPLRSEADVDLLVGALQAEKLAEVLSSSQLRTSPERDAAISIEAPRDNACGLAIRVAPLASRPGMVRLRVQPQLTSGASSAPAHRRIETEVQLVSGQSFAITGWMPSDLTPEFLSRLFPGQAKAPLNRELIVLVTPGDSIKKVAAR
jgi:hypothetical protein